MAIPLYLFDLGTFLQTSGIGTLGTDIHYRTFDNVTMNDIVLIPSSGQGNNNVISKDDLLYSPGLTINVRNLDGDLAESKANAIYDLLNLLCNTYIGETRFKRIEALSPPFFLAQDDNNCYIYSINFLLQLQ